MPGIVIHSWLAQRILDRWAEADGAPFHVHDPAARNAFLSGAWAPDMGMLPGGDEIISDLAHYVQTGDLVRELVRRARSDVQRAFAWGWCSHVLADIMIHPLVNQGVGALLYDDRSRQVAYADDPVAHMQVELGLDAVWWRHYACNRACWFSPALDREGIEYLEDAFAAVYGDGVVTAQSLGRSHRVSARFSRFFVQFTSIVARRLENRFPWHAPVVFACIYLPARLFTPLLKHSTLFAATHAVRPESWLWTQLDASMNAFPDRFEHLVATRLRELGNTNLDLGYIEPEDAVPYARTAAAKQALARRRNAIAAQR